MNEGGQIKDFFDAKRQDVRNNEFFVRKVMNRLPERRNPFSKHIALITSVLATILCLIAGSIWGYELSRELLASMIRGVCPPVNIVIIPVLLIGIFSFCLYELVYTLNED